MAIEEEGMEHDADQVDDTLLEEGKVEQSPLAMVTEQPIKIVSRENQDDDVTSEDSRITVILIVHDDEDEEPQVRVKIHKIEPDTSLASLMATYCKESE